MKLKFKKPISYFLLFLILLGAVLGMVITNSMNMFYNALIMPFIGGLGYLLLGKYTVIFPLGLLSFTCIWQTIQLYLTEGITHGSSILSLFLMALFYAVIFTFFSIIGIVIAWLLHYAFRKD